MPITEAFNALGQFAGDDTIAIEMNSGCIGGLEIATVGAMMGQRIVVDEFKCNEPGVNYLSRFYSNEVWHGNKGSNCDLIRALAKLHVTPNLSTFTPIMKLQQKLSGLSRTDRLTPVISEIIDAAERLGMKLDAQYNKQISSWWAKYDLDVNWPCNVVDDMHDYLQYWLKDNHYQCLVDYLLACTDVNQLLTMPLLIDRAPPKPHNLSVAVIAPDLVIDPVAQIIESMVNVSIQPTICPKFLKHECTGPCTLLHKKVCNSFQTGACKRGDKCKFEHIKA